LRGFVFVNTLIGMEIEFDPVKDAINQSKHGISLTLAAGMDLTEALIHYDDRAAPEEDRWIAFGFIGATLHVMVFTERDEKIRPISLRTADKPERKHYDHLKTRYGR
jgi:uncharacterized DUF497 family protein